MNMIVTSGIVKLIAVPQVGPSQPILRSSGRELLILISFEIIRRKSSSMKLSYMNAHLSLATCTATLKCNKHLRDTVPIMISISDRKGFLEWYLFQLLRNNWCLSSLKWRILNRSSHTKMMY